MSHDNAIRALQQFFAQMQKISQELLRNLQAGDQDQNYEESSHQLSQLTSGSKKSSKSRVKKEKDPLAPKKPITAFFLYFSQKRESIAAKHPELKGHEITRKVAQLWNEMPEDKKKKYVEDANKDKQRYTSEMQLYNGGGKQDSQKAQAEPAVEKPAQKKVKTK